MAFYPPTDPLGTFEEMASPSPEAQYLRVREEASRTPQAPVPRDAKERKQTPIYSGVLKYFPDAMAAIAQCSFIGNEQHNPGEPLHWAKEKSTDEHDALVRHLLEAGTVDTDGIRHSTKVAWRALAALQREIDSERA